MLTVARKVSATLWTSELRCATGRSAIRHLLRLIDVEAVLMPSYVPEGVILPVKDAGLPIIFYRLNADLMPDMDDLVPLMASHRALVIVINYFGLEAPVAEIRRQAAGCYVLEDCAQALWAKAEHADFALWSINKFLPVIDGAILRSRQRDVDVRVRSMPLQELPADARYAYAAHLGMNRMVMFTQSQQIAADWMIRSRECYEEYYRYIRANFDLVELSQESAMAEGNAEWPADEQVKRACNALAYHMHMPDEFLHVKELGTPTPPLFAYPIICPLPREAALNELLKVGVAAVTCIDRWDHIPREDRFSNELHFLAHHLLLPIDGDVTSLDIARMGKCLRGLAPARKMA